VGASSLEQLVENIGASGKSIPLTDLEQLRAMF
jgi:aryl-alcohol dehydrogenase-like predicted oxidoreductase